MSGWDLRIPGPDEGDARPDDSYVTYVLECGKPAPWFEPSRHWEAVAAGADKRRYVGHTNNLANRVRQHLDPTSDMCAEFTEMFPPERVLVALGMPSRAAAKKVEENIKTGAFKLHKAGEVFVYQW